MSDSKHFYITTTLPYVNAKPHVGFAMEIIRADAIARFQELSGKEVFFNTGTDEHGSKIYERAQEEGKDTQSYVDELAGEFRKLKDVLGLWDNLTFIRTTDTHHVAAAQAFWKKVDENGYIYKKNYKVKYCVGCELEKTDSELVDGRCDVHPNKELEIREEENYFFKFSEFGDKLLALYKEKPDFVIPDFRFNEIKKFVEGGLQDFSISRVKEKMPWGVPVPGDDTQVMYVWFDALVNYISTIGWPTDTEKFEKWWPVVQYAGKDNLRQQSAMWQAMLMAADLPPSENIIINGFITSGGQKMSKSLGNVIDPFSVVDEYGKDALRYFLLREIPSFEDGDFTMERFREAYTANLVNGIGNLASRILKMSEDHVESVPELSDELPAEYTQLFESYDLGKVSDFVWQEIGELDKHIQDTEPFKVVKEDKEKGVELISGLIPRLYTIALMLRPLMPETAEKIIEAIKQNKKPEPLFERK